MKIIDDIKERFNEEQINNENFWRWIEEISTQEYCRIESTIIAEGFANETNSILIY